MAQLFGVDVIKSISMVLFFLIVMGFATLPMWSKFFSPRADNPHQRAAATVCSLSNALSGGLFISLGMIHLLPEAAEQFAAVEGEATADKYRPAFAVAIAAYTALLVLQRVIFSGHGHSHGDHGHQHGVDGRESVPHADYGALKTAADESLKMLGTTTWNSREALVGSVGMHVSPGDAKHSTGEGNELLHEQQEEIRHSTRRSDNFARVALENPIAAPTVTKLVTSLVLALSFSLHGFAEGMSLGLQKEPDAALLLFGAITLHKWAEALSVGVSFSKTGLPRSQVFLYIVSFALSTPIGIAVGWASSALLPETLTAYFLAFSTGTFLYIGASDVIVEEFAHGGRNALKLLFYLVGLGLVYLVTAFMDHDHADDGADASGLSGSGST
jgi:zinc transporter 1/2/3